MNASAHFERMQQRFEEAAVREHGRRARRRALQRGALTAAAAVVLVAVALVALNLRGSPAEASTVRVERSGDQVTVHLVGLVTDPGRLARDLDDAGLAAEVSSRTTGPSRVGTILSVTVGAASGDVLLRSDPQSYTYVVTPDARARLDLGVPAAPGAPYDQPVDATAAGEPMHCRVALGDDVASARAAARLDGVTVTWARAEPGAAPVPLDVDGLDEATATQLFVQAALGTAADRVEITVAAAVPVVATRTGAGSGCG